MGYFILGKQKWLQNQIFMGYNERIFVWLTVNQGRYGR
jgi:hypothetical protein